ncbi:hypothetical protein L218DRAFT_673697 [Marasmius fiardii PR-910]|nr:hypothetical protein L218DRAFT_673697 [Marasmius fiardii PR-910]
MLRFSMPTLEELWKSIIDTPYAMERKAYEQGLYFLSKLAALTTFICLPYLYVTKAYLFPHCGVELFTLRLSGIWLLCLLLCICTLIFPTSGRPAMFPPFFLLTGTLHFIWKW